MGLLFYPPGPKPGGVGRKGNGMSDRIYNPFTQPTLTERVRAELFDIMVLAALGSMATILAVIAALLGEYWWGVLGRMGVNSPISWIIGFIIGLAQTIGGAWWAVHRITKGQWTWAN
jgi:hypothetical protein